MLLFFFLLPHASVFDLAASFQGSKGICKDYGIILLRTALLWGTFNYKPLSLLVGLCVPVCAEQIFQAPQSINASSGSCTGESSVVSSFIFCAFCCSSYTHTLFLSRVFFFFFFIVLILV